MMVKKNGVLFTLTAFALLFTTTALSQSAETRLDELRQPSSTVETLLSNTQDLLPQGGLVQKVAAVAAQRLRVSGGLESQAHVLLSLRQPMSAELRLELAGSGIEVVDQFDKGVWIARTDAEGAEKIGSFNDIADADIVPLAAKLSPLIEVDDPAQFLTRDDGRLAFSVLFYKGINAVEARRLEEAGLELEFEEISEQSFNLLRTAVITLSPARLAELASQDIVQWIEPVQAPNEDHNLVNTQPISNVDDVQGAPYNLDGTGVTVGIWENGDVIRATHQDLTPRVTVQPGQTASQDGHALHVAGTVGASGVNAANAEGMAPAVTILSWDDGNDTNELNVASAGANPQIVASNHSYGAILGWSGATFSTGTQGQAVFGSYNNRSVNFDTIINANDIVVVKSAGNDRNDAGPGQPRDCTQGGFAVDADCLGPVASAKNVITVGAMNGNAVIAPFSSFGPTDDGRIKPDIVANGVGVLSLGDFGVPPGGGNPTDDIVQTNTGTWTTQGTSMSAPAVTGMVALIFEELANQNIDATAAAVKSIMLQTARDVNGPGQSTLGPDFATGYGIADVQAAIDLLRRPGGPGFAEGTMTATGAGGSWEFPFVVPAGLPEVRVTLAWNDPAGTPNGTGSELVNDLDLRLLPPGGGAGVRPWQLNPAIPGQAAVRNGGDDAINNVEQVSVLTPAAGTWTVQVTAKPGSLVLGSQPFAIAGPITPATGPIAGPKANIVMVVDKSGSMVLPSATPGLNKMQALQGASNAFIDYIELVGGHNVGIVAFDTNVAITNPAFGMQPLNGTTAENARIAIGNLAPGGRTAIIAGINAAAVQLGGMNATNANDVVFLFSDGRHNQPNGSDVSIIDGIMDDDARFFSVGFGTDVDSTVMPGVASNHEGVHLEEQSLMAGQLAKLFMVVGGVVADEAIIVDPDYIVPPGEVAQQSVHATSLDRSLTFAAFWQSSSAEMQLSLMGPLGRCQIPIKPHNGVDSRRGDRYFMVRVELPYTCTNRPANGEKTHVGKWTLSARNLGNTTESVKVVVLGDSAIDLDIKSQAKGRKVLISARLAEGDVLLRRGVSMTVHLNQNRRSTGDSEKLDLMVNDRPAPDGFTIPNSGGIILGPLGLTAPASGSVASGSVASGSFAELRPTAPAAPASGSPEVQPQIGNGSITSNITNILERRALNMRLSSEIVEQLRGRFEAPSKPVSFKLGDDGMNGDRRAGDGVFSAMIEVPEPSLYQIRVVASQARKDGMLTREALDSFLAR